MNLKNKLESLMLGIILSVATSSCNSSDNNNNESEKQTSVKTEQEIQREKQKQMHDYYIYILDSVKRANNYYELCYRYHDLEIVKNDAINEINSLTYEHTLAGNMENSLIITSYPIITKAYNNIASELSKYKIKLPTTCDILQPGYLNGYYDILQLCSGDYNVFASLKEDIIYKSIDESQYSENQKNIMKDKAEKIINATIEQLLDNKQTVEKQYSDYYLITDETKQHLGYINGEGDPEFGYSNLNEYQRYRFDTPSEKNYLSDNTKYLATIRSIRVYDANLSIDFFNDKDANYKLVSVGENKWQIIKTTKSGKVSKSHIFTDNSTYDTYQTGTNEKPEKLYTFDILPGKHVGVRIDVTETQEVKRRKKDWVVTIPHEEKQYINSLKNNVISKTDLALQQKEDSITDIYYQADSIASNLVYERFGQHIR